MMSDQPPMRNARRVDISHIQTQIHRRKKAKAFSALAPEWDHTDRMPPFHLRMPSSRMTPTVSNRALIKNISGDNKESE
jgi:hypothetical protein